MVPAVFPKGFCLAKISKVQGYQQESYTKVRWYNALMLIGGRYGHVFDATGCMCLKAVLILFSVTHGLISPCGTMDTYYW